MNSSLSELSSADLASNLVALRARQRLDDVDFLRMLGEFDRREAFLPLGFPSLWEYCKAHLQLSGGSAFRRITAARLIVRFPLIAGYLGDGRLSLGGLSKLKDILTDDNLATVLDQAAHRTEDDVEVLARTYRPIPFVRDTTLRTVRTPVVSGPLEGPTAPPPPTVQASHALPLPEQASTSIRRLLPRATARPLDADHISLTLRVETAFMDELEQVSAALSHVVPSRAPSEVIRECIRRTLEELKRKKGGLPAREPRATSSVRPGTDATLRSDPSSASGSTSRPERAPARVASASAVDVTCRTPVAADGSATSATADSAGASCSLPDSSLASGPRGGPRLTSRREAAASTAAADAPRGSFTSTLEVNGAPADGGSRVVPAAVARAVWARDGGRCAFVGSAGRRCGSTHQLELHHQHAFALGGPTTLGNLSLRCRRHNAFEAQRDFGAELMERFRGPR